MSVSLQSKRCCIVTDRWNVLQKHTQNILYTHHRCTTSAPKQANTCINRPHSEYRLTHLCKHVFPSKRPIITPTMAKTPHFATTDTHGDTNVALGFSLLAYLQAEQRPHLHVVIFEVRLQRSALFAFQLRGLLTTRYAFLFLSTVPSQ